MDMASFCGWDIESLKSLWYFAEVIVYQMPTAPPREVRALGSECDHYGLNEIQQIYPGVFCGEVPALRGIIHSVIGG